MIESSTPLPALYHMTSHDLTFSQSGKAVLIRQSSFQKERAYLAIGCWWSWMRTRGALELGPICELCLATTCSSLMTLHRSHDARHHLSISFRAGEKASFSSISNTSPFHPTLTMTKNHPSLRPKTESPVPSTDDNTMQPPSTSSTSTTPVWADAAAEQRAWPGGLLEPTQGDTLFSSSMFARSISTAPPAVPPKVPETFLTPAAAAATASPTPSPPKQQQQQQQQQGKQAPARSSYSTEPADYTQPFCTFLTSNPTVYHAVAAVAADLTAAGYTRLSERDVWKLELGGKYFVERNGSSLVAFAVGEAYEAGNGAAILAGHIDALTAKLKPIPKLRTKAGYEQLGVAPYAGALNDTWWDRDLGVGGRVLVKEDGKIVTKLVKLDWPSEFLTTITG